jgi:hypothetical protein
MYLLNSLELACFRSAIVRNAVYVPCLAQFDPGQLWLSK